MARFLKDRSKKIGLAPGSAVFVGEKKVDQPRVDLLDFKGDFIDEKKDIDITNLEGLMNSQTVTWVNVIGLHDTQLIAKVGEYFNLHNLVIEDILNTGLRPSFIEFDDYFFVAAKMLMHDKESDALRTEQVSFVVGKNYIISFQELDGDVFDSVRERIRKQKGKIRTRGADYLCYALVDTVVDYYLNIIERFGDRIEQLEGEILANSDKKTLEKIFQYKQEMSFLRKTVRPIREVSIHFVKSESGLIKEATRPFLKDLEGLVMLAVESIETYSELLSDQLNIYQTNVSNKLNDVMRVLTIFSVVFIPLTFIAGIYGTNFEYFPELKFRYAYPVFWATLIFVAMGMIYYFKRKKWL